MLASRQRKGNNRLSIKILSTGKTIQTIDTGRSFKREFWTDKSKLEVLLHFLCKLIYGFSWKTRKTLSDPKPGNNSVYDISLNTNYRPNTY